MVTPSGNLDEIEGSEDADEGSEDVEVYTNRVKAEIARQGWGAVQTSHEKHHNKCQKK